MIGSGRDSGAMAKIRADQMLVDRGLVESRTRAQALIMAGLVFAGTRKIEKPGQTLAEDVALDVRGRDHPWVSRGGVKLAHGLAQFAHVVAVLFLMHKRRTAALLCFCCALLSF